MASNTPEPGTVPPELLAHVIDQARRDADRTASVLEAIGLHPPPEPSFSLSEWFLLEFGAAMRLLAWERDGVDVSYYGLPTARVAARRVLADASARQLDPSSAPHRPELSSAVLRVTIDSWAWTGQTDLQADIRLGMADEDTLVDVMAQFLWDHRDRSVHQGGTTSP
jgi:hypothetical protein